MRRLVWSAVLAAQMTSGVVFSKSLLKTTPEVLEAPPVSLTLRITGGQTQFHPGETIPIQLEFTSATRGRYSVDGATYDRSGRMTVDRFRVDPDRGVTDPLFDYLACGSFMGGPGTEVLSGSCREQATHVVSSAGELTIDITLWPESQRPNVRLAQYNLRSIDALKLKLSQYPKGTEFTLKVEANHPDSAFVEADIRKAADALGVRLR